MVIDKIFTIINASTNAFYTVNVWKHDTNNITLKMLQNYLRGVISGAKKQLEKFETFYMENREFYEKRHRVNCFKGEIVEEIVLNYFTILLDKIDWIKDDHKLETWCDEYGADNYEDSNLFADALRQNGWKSLYHYYVISGDINLAIKNANIR